MQSIDKKGQPAAGAAILLVVIAGLLVMFVILLPPSERAELLGENISKNATSTLDEAVDEETLLVESPGRIDFLGQREIEHPLPVINIFTTTGTEVLAEKNVVSAKRALFTEKTDSMRFTIKDLDNTENLLLSFSVERGKGELLMTLNGETIFDAEVEAGVLPPVQLPSNTLQEQNELLFSVSSPGMAFWATHEAVLKEVQVIADVTDVGAQAASSIFLVSDTEKNNLEKVTLRFQPDCIFDQVGKLTVVLNGRVLYSAVPDCDLAFVPIEISPTVIVEGENEIAFRAERGSYLLSHVLLESRLREVEFPTYFFELSHEQFGAIKREDLRLRLELDFVDTVSRKFGEIIINGHTRGFDTKEVNLVMDISDEAVRGNNAVKIQPQKTIEVRELQVDLVE